MVWADVRCVTPIRDSLLFPAFEPASSSPQASLGRVQASRERPWLSPGSARSPSPTRLSARAHTLHGGRESGLLPPGPASCQLRGLPLHRFPPGQEPGQGYTDQRGKSALRLPGAAFQEEERLAEAHGPTPTGAGAQAGQGPAPHGPQHPQTPPTAQKHKHPPGPC